MKNTATNNNRPAETAKPASGNPTNAITRRHFLARAGASAFSLTVLNPNLVRAAAAKSGASTGKKVVVGGHPWVYAATQPNYDITPVLPAIFEDMSYAGLDGIELMHTALRPKEAVERIGELSRKHRLPVIGMSFGGAIWDRAQHQEVLEDAELIIPRLAKLGGRTLGTSVGAAPKRKTEQQLDDQAGLLRKLIALCQSHGVVLNLHNHTYEVADNLHDLKGTLARIPEVKLGPDLNWLVRAGVDPAWFIRQFGKQIVFMHLRDQKQDGRWSEALGEGDTDFAAIGRALHEIGFDGDAVIELAHEKDFQRTRPLRETWKLSRNFVKQVLGY
ncbi:MAG: sugar phosphate isomerase/epimerase family protein [Verrucomicrobiota bacterium]|jgi:sugar phosphate isomerase/epimerase